MNHSVPLASSSSLTKRICLGLALVLTIACGGGGELKSDRNRVLLQLTSNGSSTAVFRQKMSHALVLRASSPDAALRFVVSFQYEDDHFEPIQPVEVFLPAGTEREIQFDIIAREIANVEGEISMIVDVPSQLAAEPLTYTIEP